MSLSVLCFSTFTSMSWNEFSQEAESFLKAVIPTVVLRKISGTSHFPSIILFSFFLFLWKASHLRLNALV